jgi:threonyl-tRNA synthetase
VSTEQIQVQLPDGSRREVARGTTPFEIAASISPRLAAAVVIARIRPLAGSTQASESRPGAPASDASSDSEAAMYGAAATGDDGTRLVDLAAPLQEDVELWLLKEADEAALKVLRHSAAHVMATAILELFPETKLGHGPATDNGFFYDVYRETPFTEADLAAIEARMAEVVARNEPFVRVEEPREAGLKDYSTQGEFMKVYFIEKFTKPGDEISLYKNGDFTDFCRGPHLPSTGRVKAFKITSIAGAYWLGDEKNQQLQRIYGTAFFNAKDLDAHSSTYSQSRKSPVRASSSGIRRAASSARRWKTGCAKNVSVAATCSSLRRTSCAVNCGRSAATKATTARTCTLRWSWTTQSTA